jgi:hypothetical protein
MVFNMTYLRINGRKINSKHFQLVRLSYQKLDYHGISRFSAVFVIIIISMLGGTIQEPWIQKVYLGFLLTDPTKKNLSRSGKSFSQIEVYWTCSSHRAIP